MKTSTLLLVAICFFTACKKDTAVAPDTGTQSHPATTPQSSANSASGQTPTSGTGSTGVKPAVTAVLDTIPDKAVLKLKLVKDSVNYDETMFIFDHTASLLFDINDDAPYMSGYGPESLASMSSDGRDLIINTLPYKQGLSIGLDVGAKADGAFALQVSYLKNIPADIQVIVRDNYLKDSLDVRTGPYQFNIVKSDAATYGTSRFSLVFRNKAH